jgi:protein-S-isoprenylcysteine O-methyltransferase Ste14
MAKQSPLDDPRTSAHAWSRYKRLMKWMGAFTLAVVVVTLGLFFWFGGDVPIHFFIATALGIGFMMMLTAALMGLVFLSSGTGHDESVSDLTDDQAP